MQMFTQDQPRLTVSLLLCSRTPRLKSSFGLRRYAGEFLNDQHVNQCEIEDYIALKHSLCYQSRWILIAEGATVAPPVPATRQHISWRPRAQVDVALQAW